MALASSVFVARMTTDELDAAIKNRPVVILLPVGAIEPHGPHLPLDTDLIISRAAAERAVHALAARDLLALVAPDVAYGVTEFARDFSGAVSVSNAAFAAYLRGVVDGWLRCGAAHVCVVNNHLEPAHDDAVREAVAGFDSRQASVASPLTRKWGRTLSEEFKRGACHAGEYESSIVMAAAPESVRDEVRATLPPVEVSLSEQIAQGRTSFTEIGMTRSYCGDPARATAAHGQEMLARLAEMIVGEVTAALS